MQVDDLLRLLLKIRLTSTKCCTLAPLTYHICHAVRTRSADGVSWLAATDGSYNLELIDLFTFICKPFKVKVLTN